MFLNQLNIVFLRLFDVLSYVLTQYYTGHHILFPLYFLNFNQL